MERQREDRIRRGAAARAWLAAACTLAACGRPPATPGDAREPAVPPAGPTPAPAAVADEAERSGVAASPAGTTPRDLGDGWSLHWEPTRGPRLEAAAALDVERVVALGDGKLFRAGDGRWSPVELDGAEALAVAAVDGVLWVRIRDTIVDVPRWQTLRSTDGRTFEPAELPGGWPEAGPAGIPPHACREPPEWFAPALQAPVGAGRIVALGPGGAAAVCPVSKRELVERWFENGTAGWFEELRPPGWVPATGARLPREPLAVLDTEPPLAVGREGQLAAIRCDERGCAAETLIDEPHPRVLELLSLADGALLAALDDRLVRLADGSATTVEPDAEGRQWLVEAARPGVWGPHPVLGAALGGGTAVLSAVGQARGLWVAGVSGRGFALELEPLGAARAGEGAAVLLLNGGRVLRGSPGAWRELGHLGTIPPEGVSHAFGVFAGADGIVRLLDPRRPVVCATAATLEPCGEVVEVDEREVFQLPDGLVVETQHITTTLASADGIRDRDVLPVWKIHDYAGSVSRLWALTETRAGGDHRSPPEFRVRRLDGAEWIDVAPVPPECAPQALAVAEDTVFVACAGGAVLRRASGR
jgi:hypothetical protein